jgi:trk system potassium uptake protein TrkA
LACASLRRSKGAFKSNSIERDKHRARRAAEVLREAIVLNGDAADEELLIEENVDGADVFVAVTNAEEANILRRCWPRELAAAR